MGGGGGGSGISSSDMSKLQQAADERLRILASNSTRVLFVCETTDRASLDAHIAASKVFRNDRLAVLDGSRASAADELIGSSTFLVVFTDAATNTRFLDAIIDKALVKKMGAVHVKSQPKSPIPSKVTAYRWRSITWAELEEIFREDST
jgi:hypothetical protein